MSDAPRIPALIDERMSVKDLTLLAVSPSDRYIKAMADLNLTADERAAPTKLVRDTIAADPYPLSPRIRRLKALLAKLDPSPAPASKPHPAD